MVRKIPEPIRREVIKQWLEGVPRDQIATENQIGTGTVSEIIKSIKEKGAETKIDVLREVAVMVKRKGLSIDDFAYSIRLKQYLNEIGLKDEKLEDFARHLEVHFFKRDLAPDAFVNVFANVSSLSEKLGVPVEDLPEHINKSKELLDNIELRIKSLITKQKRVMANYNITMTDLEEYRTNRPFVEALKSKNMELEKLKIRILDMQAKLSQVMTDLGNLSEKSYLFENNNICLKMGGLVISRFILLYFGVFMMTSLLYNSPNNAIASTSFGMQEITNRHQYKILMLGFTDDKGSVANKRVEYNIKINNINGAELFTGSGSTKTGFDLKLINATALPINSHLNIKVILTRFNDNVVNENSKPQMTVIP